MRKEERRNPEEADCSVFLPSLLNGRLADYSPLSLGGLYSICFTLASIIFYHPLWTSKTFSGVIYHSFKVPMFLEACCFSHPIEVLIVLRGI